MSFFRRRAPIARLLLTLTALAATASSSRGDFSISNNLGGVTGGSESAVGDTWITAGFGSGSTGGELSSVTLLLANPVAGQAAVEIYADAGLEPGTSLGALTLAGAYSTTRANTTFTASGITLAANTNYWVVLKATTGQFDWSWTLSNIGTGVGYQNTWGSSEDRGVTWFTFDSFPTQMDVQLVSPSAAVPEPGTWFLWGSGFVGVALIGKRNRTTPRPLATPLG